MILRLVRHSRTLVRVGETVRFAKGAPTARTLDRQKGQPRAQHAALAELHPAAAAPPAPLETWKVRENEKCSRHRQHWLLDGSADHKQQCPRLLEGVRLTILTGTCSILHILLIERESARDCLVQVCLRVYDH